MRSQKVVCEWSLCLRGLGRASQAVTSKAAGVKIPHLFSGRPYFHQLVCSFSWWATPKQNQNLPCQPYTSKAHMTVSHWRLCLINLPNCFVLNLIQDWSLLSDKLTFLTGSVICLCNSTEHTWFLSFGFVQKTWILVQHDYRQKNPIKPNQKPAKRRGEIFKDENIL